MTKRGKDKQHGGPAVIGQIFESLQCVCVRARGGAMTIHHGAPRSCCIIKTKIIGIEADLYIIAELNTSNDVFKEATLFANGENLT